MINIYCLIDPRTNSPFYVGCTKTPLKTRLSGHIQEIKTYHGRFKSAKQLFIDGIVKEGLKPDIILLANVDITNADHCERFYYNVFTKLGFALLQKPSAFFYSRKMNTESINYNNFKNT